MLLNYTRPFDCICVLNSIVAQSCPFILSLAAFLHCNYGGEYSPQRPYTFKAKYMSCVAYDRKRVLTSSLKINIYKTTVRYYLIPIRMVIINKSTNNKGWRRCRERGKLLHCWWECKLVPALWKTVQKFLRKLNIDMIQQSHPQAYIWTKLQFKRYMHPYIHNSNIHNSQDLETT